MPRDQPLGDHQALLQVGEGIAHVPAHLGQLGRAQLARARREADHEEVVAREARAHQVIERERDALGGREAAGPRHRPAHVEQQHRGGERVVVALAQLEVVDAQLDRQRERPAGRGARAALHRREQRAHDVDVERVAELEGPRLVGARQRGAARVDLVRAGPILARAPRRPGQRVRADAADRARRELRVAAAQEALARAARARGRAASPASAPRRRRAARAGRTARSVRSRPPRGPRERLQRLDALADLPARSRSPPPRRRGSARRAACRNSSSARSRSSSSSSSRISSPACSSSNA